MDESSKKGQVLLIHDEPGVLEHIHRALSDSYDVTCVHTLREAFKRCRCGRFHLAVVDLDLPCQSVLALIARVRAIDPNLGFVIITGDADLAYGIRIVHKSEVATAALPSPDVADVCARVRYAMEDMGRLPALPTGQDGIDAEPPRVQVGDLRIDAESRRVWRGSEQVLMSKAEFELLL